MELPDHQKDSWGGLHTEDWGWMEGGRGGGGGGGGRGGVVGVCDVRFIGPGRARLPTEANYNVWLW